MTNLINLSIGPFLKVNGQWGLWSDVTYCSKSCGGGNKESMRVCDNPAPKNGGTNCTGISWEKLKECNTEECPGLSHSNDIG